MAEGNGMTTMDQDESGDDSVVVTLGPVVQPPFMREKNQSEDYETLIAYGLDEKVASKLDEIYKTGKLAHADLDERALDALKEFPVEGALNVLVQLLDANLEHVSNKSAYLCGVMKTYRQKSRAGQGSQPNNLAKAPDEDKIKSILERTGYTLDVTTGQRKYGGPPPGWDGPTPGNGCEVFCGKIPRDMYEDELIPLFENCGKIWDLRLMMDPMTGLNRGYAFITFTGKEAAQQAVRELDNYEIKQGKTLKVNISVPNLRLFVGNIPKSKGKEEITEEFGKLTAGLTEVIIYSSPDDKKKNRGFCFLEYESHKAASLAKRRLGTGRIKVWGCDIIVDWADPQEEPDEETMSKVKVLYVRNLTVHCTEESLKDSFEAFGNVERVKKIKDYAFIHFEDRMNALKAMEELNGQEMGGANIEVSLAKPPSDKKKKEEMLRARERRMMQILVQRGGSHRSPSPSLHTARHMRHRAPIPGAHMIRAAIARGDYDVDFEYYGYGDYRGGYSDPYYDDYYRYEDFYYDYLPPPPRGVIRRPMPAGRGRGVVARGRAGGPPARGRGASGAGGGRVGGSSAGAARGAGPRTTGRGGGPRAPAKTNIAGEDGKRKFDGGHQNPGESKRRYQNAVPGASGGNWGNQPIPQQPLTNSYSGLTSGMNGNSYSNSGGDQQWYQDSYGQSWS
ncbi:heterogeneous nuclear ribonucleoprotein Q-like [Ischnura elegans]|uniref:heterogeneous nuclear ribonucleoprotein Q-like n=1 Tax=Ischnura elegans TaxID=197161 RepID=UPI001ED88048|nr:heterogeneous nuclear ribonucleoprotein Q-like [Ischnura elegans]